MENTCDPRGASEPNIPFSLFDIQTRFQFCSFPIFVLMCMCLLFWPEINVVSNLRENSELELGTFRELRADEASQSD